MAESAVACGWVSIGQMGHCPPHSRIPLRLLRARKVRRRPRASPVNNEIVALGPRNGQSHKA